jgi:hypothetical protein
MLYNGALHQYHIGNYARAQEMLENTDGVRACVPDEHASTLTQPLPVGAAVLHLCATLRHAQRLPARVLKTVRLPLLDAGALKTIEQQQTRTDEEQLDSETQSRWHQLLMSNP